MTSLQYLYSCRLRNLQTGNSLMMQGLSPVYLPCMMTASVQSYWIAECLRFATCGADSMNLQQPSNIAHLMSSCVEGIQVTVAKLAFQPQLRVILQPYYSQVISFTPAMGV